jgi:hypothetical protein
MVVDDHPMAQVTVTRILDHVRKPFDKERLVKLVKEYPAYQ